MNEERVTRTTLPQVTVGMPLSLLKWVDEQAGAAGMSRSRFIVLMIECVRKDGLPRVSEMAAAS